MIELLCVVAIIGILASLLLPAVMRSYLRIKGAADEMDGPTVAFRLEEEARRYCSANTNFHFDSKEDFIAKCQLAPKCRNWVNASQTEFVPFTYLDPTNLMVLTIHIGPKYRTQFNFTKGNLSLWPDR